MGGDALPAECGALAACQVDDYECRTDDLYHCETDADGCPVWVLDSHCEGDTPVCSAKSGACECDPAEPSTCVDESTVRRCLGGAWTEEACEGGASTCNADAGACQCTTTDPPRCADDKTLSTCQDGLWDDAQCPDENPVCNPDTVSCECDAGSQSDYCDGDGVTLQSCQGGKWVGTECAGDTPFCNAGADQCACDPATAPTCEDLNTVRYCGTDGTWRTDPCEGTTPVCSSSVGGCQCDSSEPANCTADLTGVRTCQGGTWTISTCPSLTPSCNPSTSKCVCDPAKTPDYCAANGTDLMSCVGGKWQAMACGGDTPVCNTTTNRCECNGSPQCSGSTLRVCSGGQWNDTTCAGTTPVCNKTAGRCDCNTTSLPNKCTDSATLRRCVSGQSKSDSCSSLDSTLPTCNTGTNKCECTSAQASYCSSSSWMHCSGGSWASTACSGAKPVCDASGGCMPCTEHSQCPSGACHLSEYSASYGSCFPTSAVQNITAATGLQTAIDALTSSSVAVFKLSATSYPVSSLDAFSGTPIPNGAEIAIIGKDGAAITGKTTAVYSSSVPMLIISGIVYLSNVDINTPGCNMTALGVGGDYQQSPPPVLWLDDMALTQWGTALATTAADTHIRRSVIRSTYDYSVKVDGGALYIENSVLGPDGSPPQAAALYTTTGPFIDIRYSNLWGYDLALYCNDGVTGSTQGSIRNSILLNQDSTTSSIDAKCTALTFPGAAGTGLGLAPTVNWFTDVANNDFHLTTTGANQLGRTATWAAGDPLVDIDGVARVKGSKASYAGIDER